MTWAPLLLQKMMTSSRAILSFHGIGSNPPVLPPHSTLPWSLSNLGSLGFELGDDLGGIGAGDVVPGDAVRVTISVMGFPTPAPSPTPGFRPPLLPPLPPPGDAGSSQKSGSSSSSGPSMGQ